MSTDVERYRLKDHKGYYCSAEASGEIVCNRNEVSKSERFDFHITKNPFGNDYFGLMNAHGKYCSPQDTTDVFDVFTNKTTDITNIITDSIKNDISVHNKVVENNSHAASVNNGCASSQRPLFPSGVDDYRDKNRLTCSTNREQTRYLLTDNQDGTISFMDNVTNKWCAPNSKGHIVCDDSEIDKQNIFEIWNEVPHVKMHHGNTIDSKIGLSTSECVKECAKEKGCAGVSIKNATGDCGATNNTHCDIPESRCLLKSNILLIDKLDPNYSHIDLEKKNKYVPDDISQNCSSGEWQHSKYKKKS